MNYPEYDQWPVWVGAALIGFYALMVCSVASLLMG